MGNTDLGSCSESVENVWNQPLSAAPLHLLICLNN